MKHEEIFEMSNIRAEHSGLDVVIWISQKMHSKHAARIKVSNLNKASDINSVIQIDPKDDIRITKGNIKAKRFKEIRNWVLLNYEDLMELWNEEIDFEEFKLRQKSS